MAAHTSLIYCIGAIYLVTSPAGRRMSLAGKFFSENNFTHNIPFKPSGKGTAAETHKHFTPITEIFHWVTEANFHILTNWKNFAT